MNYVLCPVISWGVFGRGVVFFVKHSMIMKLVVEISYQFLKMFMIFHHRYQINDV